VDYGHGQEDRNVLHFLAEISPIYIIGRRVYLELDLKFAARLFQSSSLCSNYVLLGMFKYPPPQMLYELWLCMPKTVAVAVRPAS